MGERARRSGLSTARIGILAALNTALAAAALRPRARANAARSPFAPALGPPPEAVTITAAERRIRYANQAAADILGYASPADLVASPPGTIRDEWVATHPDGRPIALQD